MAEKQAALPRFSPLMIWGSINIPARQKAPGNPRRDGRFYSLAGILQRTSLIFPGEYPHPCPEIPGGKKFLPPPPRENFEKWTPRPPGFVNGRGVYLFISIPHADGNPSAFGFGFSFVFENSTPPIKEEARERKENNAAQGKEEERKKEYHKEETQANKRSRQLPSAHTMPGIEAAPSPHTRTHSVLRVHVLHYIRRLAAERSA